jgi:hypothetical protein
LFGIPNILFVVYDNKYDTERNTKVEHKANSKTDDAIILQLLPGQLSDFELV